MSRLFAFRSQSRSVRSGESRHLRRPLRTGLGRGMIVALLALVLGVGLGLRGPIAHAEPACYQSTVDSATKYFTIGVNKLKADFVASYHSADGSYCGHTWAMATLFLGPGQAGGQLRIKLLDCAGRVITEEIIHDTGGGGDPSGHGHTYYLQTTTPYLTCGAAWADFYRSSSHYTASTAADGYDSVG